MDDLKVVVRFPERVTDFSLLQYVKTGCGAQPASTELISRIFPQR
jgi:hypothetical protein